MLRPCFIAILGALAMLLSCQNDDSMALAPDCRKVSLSIAYPESRAEIDVNGNFTFAAGDMLAIYSQGLYSDMEGMQAAISDKYGIVYEGDYVYNGDAGAVFHTVYPYSASSGYNSAKHTVATNQSDAAQYKGSYFLYSIASGSKAMPNVTLTFDHAMALVKVKVNDEAQVESAKLCNVMPTAKLEFGTVDAASVVSATGEKCSIDMHRMSGNEFHALVPPQTLQANSFTIEILIGSDTYTFSHSADISLASGRICSFCLTPSTGSSKYEFPENSIIPEVKAGTVLEKTDYTYAYYEPRPNQGIWSYNTKATIKVLDEGGGFTGNFYSYYSLTESSRPYYAPSLILWCCNNLNLKSIYTLTYDAKSETGGKLGVAVYAFNDRDEFFYHASSNDNGTILDSTTARIEHSMTSDWKHVVVSIDPSKGSPQYKNKNGFVDNSTNLDDCIIVFYNGEKNAVKYSIKNIAMVPEPNP